MRHLSVFWRPKLQEAKRYKLRPEALGCMELSNNHISSFAEAKQNVNFLTYFK